MYGKYLAANSLAVINIVFVAQHPIIPSDFRDRFTSKLFDFIWNRKDNQPRYEPVKRETLYAQAKDGGINAVCIK